MLELIVNERTSGIVAPVESDGARLIIPRAYLRRAGIAVAGADSMVAIDALAGVRAEYDAPRQQLRLFVDSSLLPPQQLEGRRRGRTRVQYDMGALLNYDVYVSGGRGRKLEASLVHEARIFVPAGTLSTTGVLRSARSGKAYVRLDTVWRRSDEATATTIEVGDFITRTLPWAPAVRLGGIQVSRDFSVRPDIVTYPLPEFSGRAALPSTVDLLIGGQRVAGGEVAPGPFAIDALPPISGAGTANLVVTDLHGNSIAAALPFYVSTDLLRPGLTDFSVAFGALRENYGRSNFDYGRVAASATLRQGLTPGITLEVRGEIAGGTEVTGGGAVARLGQFGTLSGSYSRSFGEGRGGEWMLGYQYQSRRLTLALRHSRRDAGYRDIGLVGLATQGALDTTSATLSLSLGRGGTLGLGYFAFARSDGPDSRVVNASWALPLWRGSRLSASATHGFEDDNWSGLLGFNIPLGGAAGTVNAAYIDGPTGQQSWRADYSRAIPTDGGLGWSASAVYDRAGRFDARGNVGLRTNAALLRAGGWSDGGGNFWAGASGSLVFMDGSLFAANRIADAFAVVSTGEPGIPVRYENQRVGETNGQGRLLIPSASAYYPASYAIDPLGLPANARVPVVTQEVAIARGSGHVIRFPVERLHAARATLVDESGAPLPAGALAQIDGRDPVPVGWDGLLFIEDSASKNSLSVTLPGGARCLASFAVPGGTTDTIVDIGDITCHRATD
ncbi:fimbria/pilus outer membrane usher protein [Sphingopyxis terrae]|uniref:fimbria/pilus outer membrane usher protein n=1 Tax=Sphingopyxis terrae TaxID=33052 RepID=UPI002A0B07D5|nr:fimbria/pilus outer membrane usher protein [Sphingopyxis terrae]MDX8357595.1 fimbria/pilus outer membrane usher protein [Sphingopyxis terrae]